MNKMQMDYWNKRDPRIPQEYDRQLMLVRINGETTGSWVRKGNANSTAVLAEGMRMLGYRVNSLVRFKRWK